MAKRRTIGTILFGIVFILLAFIVGSYTAGIVLAYFPGGKDSPSSYIYKGYLGRIKSLEEFHASIKDLAPAANQAFTDKLKAFKQEAETFRREFVERRRIPWHTLLVMAVGMVSVLLCSITGLALLIHFPWARKWVFYSLGLLGAFYVGLINSVYSIMQETTQIHLTVHEMVRILDPTTPIITLTKTTAFEVLFANPVQIIIHACFALFIFLTAWFFRRTDIKERFNQQ